MPVNVGVPPCVHITVRDTVDVLLQASLAINFLVCDRVQPVDWTAPSTDELMGLPQKSVAVALPSAAAISSVDGLTSSITSEYVPVKVGARSSSDQVTDCLFDALIVNMVLFCCQCHTKIV